MKKILILTIGVISISFSAIFIRFCPDVPVISIAAWRMVIASCVLIAIAVARKVRFTGIRKREWGIACMGAVFLTLHFASWITSLKLTSVASSVALVTTNPIFVGIFSWIILKEKQQKELIIGIVLSVSGSLILAVGDGGLSGLAITNKDALIGDILALTGAIMGSGYLISGSIIREKVDTFRYILMVYPLTAVLLLLVTVVGKFPLTGFSRISYINLILLALVSQLLGHTAFNWALKHLKASMVAVTILGEPIGAAILAWLFFRESISASQTIGMALIFTAIIISARKGGKSLPRDIVT
ncbi:MAG: multidrug transporter [Acidobacteria bacterium CG_4_9_14_3_um_filter_49_7]|nr:MAG: multidrug transporter [Acidobacteria bacterium CG_4_9_14_3_um_filter_49_7]